MFDLKQLIKHLVLSKHCNNIYVRKQIMKLSAAILGACLVGVAVAQDQLIWQEEFDTLDSNIWEHMVTGWRGGNHEFQYYRNDRRNSYVRNGVLYINPTLTADEYGEDFLYHGELNLWDQGCTDEYNIDGGCYITSGGDYIINPIQSARIRTKYTFSMLYGRVEIRAQVPKGDWLWPALWMLPTDDVYGGWPRSGEIDIMESKGNEDLKCNGVYDGHQRVGQTMHWGPDTNQNGFQQTSWAEIDENDPFGNNFHRYGIQWSDQGMIFTIDDVQIGSIFPPEGGFWELGGYNGNNLWESGNKMAPFDQRFHFVLNLAVGGNYFQDGCENGFGEKPWYGYFVPGAMKSFWEANAQWLPTWRDEEAALKVDYVRVYQ